MYNSYIYKDESYNHRFEKIDSTAVKVISSARNQSHSQKPCIYEYLTVNRLLIIVAQGKCSHGYERLTANSCTSRNLMK